MSTNYLGMVCNYYSTETTGLQANHKYTTNTAVHSCSKIWPACDDDELMMMTVVLVVSG